MKSLKISFIILVIVMGGSLSFAQESQPTNETAPPVPEPVVIAMPSPKPAIAPRARNQYLAAISYSPIDLPIPSKFGATVGFIKSQFQTWELEYMKGRISAPGFFHDLGGIHDTRIGIIGRSYFGNSFNLSYGISYFDFSATIGNSLTSRLSRGAYPEMNALTVQGLGLNFGFGNTWVLKHDITVGFDWLAWAQPLYITKRSSDYIQYATNENDKKNVKDTMSLVSYLPRFAVVNFHIGMLF